ncbi:MAG: nuclease [Ancylobacter novellus]|uniref:Nuclease n=1 Tax=Ancylobacter novellus TaxID=921 RepID=A0A2W5KD53_ANCNO|nr:MAG: nuclease [Ancylobacter novellus]
MRSGVVAAVLLIASVPALAGELAGRATVVDGDTIYVEGVAKNVRLFGMDAPERGQICADGAGKRFLCGVRAATELAAIIGRNGRVACREVDRDRWGRPVAICRLGSVDLSAEMIRRGWAVDFVRYSRGRYEAEQDAAQVAGAGLWAGDFEVPWEWRKIRRISQ